MIENRRYERVPFFCEVSIAALPDGPRIEAHSLDISLGGVGLTTRGSFAPGQMLFLSFKLKDASNKPIDNKVVGRVVNLRADTDANRIGVEFIEPLSQAGSPQLVDQVMRV